MKSSPSRVIVVGAGPVGIRFASELRKFANRPWEIMLFGDEPYAPYDRIKLSQLLAGAITYNEIFSGAIFSSAGSFTGNVNGVELSQAVSVEFHNRSIRVLDSQEKVVIDASGDRYHYDYLVLATGSKPHVPQIEGVDLSGVYTFRNLRDAEQLSARISRSRHIVVVGGGLLGLEVAKGLLQHNTLVTLVHQSPRLMNRQLSEQPAQVLLQRVTRQGINVITGDGLGRVLGDCRVSGIVTRQGRRIDCDTVVLCTGIKPNTELALSGGLKFNRGIVVDEKLQTSADNVFAIGECSEFQGEIYGLVAPGLEQAAVLATNLSGGQAVFKGAQPYTNLKVVDEAVSSLGEVVDLPPRPKLRLLTFAGKGNKPCRSLALYKGRILGACSVGEWPEQQRIREAFLKQRYIFPWQALLFRFSGKLWFDGANEDVKQWPENAVVCQCNQVSKFTIHQAIEQGHLSVAGIGKCCGAGAVCGSCQPLLQTLIDHSHKAGASVVGQAKGHVLWPIAVFSLLALALCLALVFMPAAQAPRSVMEPSWSWLWTETFWKRVTGFSLLAFTVIGLALSLRKRLSWTFMGNFTHWRLLHTVLGSLALFILLLHTGASLGSNLNRWLMLNYLLVAGVGSLLGLAVAYGKRPRRQVQLRKFSFWIHVLSVWPLPVLISAHVLSSYYF